MHAMYAVSAMRVGKRQVEKSLFVVLIPQCSGLSSTVIEALL